MLTETEHIVWPLTEEAFIKQGYRVKFDDQFNFVSSEKIAEIPMEQNMRPTTVVVKRKSADRMDSEIVLIGGQKDRHNMIYSVRDNTWNFIPKIPEGHNITTNVCVNYQEKAIFTVMLDAKMNIKIAVLDL